MRFKFVKNPDEDDYLFNDISLNKWYWDLDENNTSEIVFEDNVGDIVQFNKTDYPDTFEYEIANRQVADEVKLEVGDK